MTRHQLATHRGRVRLLRFAADVLHERVADVHVDRIVKLTTVPVAARLRSVGVDIDAAQLLDYYFWRTLLADVDDRAFPGSRAEAAIARLDAEEQIAWHEDNVGGDADA